MAHSTLISSSLRRKGALIASWIRAAAYKRKWDAYEKNGGEMPERDLAMDTLRGVIAGDILVHNHCYRADEMAIMIDLSKEAGYKIGTFHHAVESYKIADLLARENICSAMWADWYGFKMESYDAIKENIPFVDKAGAWYSYGDERIGQGKDNSRQYLKDNPQVATRLEGELRERFKPAEIKPEEAEEEAEA